MPDDSRIPFMTCGMCPAASVCPKVAGEKDECWYMLNDEVPEPTTAEHIIRMGTKKLKADHDLYHQRMTVKKVLGDTSWDLEDHRLSQVYTQDIAMVGKVLDTFKPKDSQNKSALPPGVTSIKIREIETVGVELVELQKELAKLEVQKKEIEFVEGEILESEGPDGDS